MIRRLALLLLLISPVPAAAQDPPISLALQPTPAPVPALKYTLLPELRDLKPGNAVLMYYRAFSPEWQTYRQDRKLMLKVADMAVKPLRTLRPADLEEFSWLTNARMLQEMDRGARRTYCDWELNDRLREDGIGLLLPDLQSFREYANFLRVRFKQELLQGRYDKAVRTLQTGLALGRDIAKGPTLIHGLVGVAIGMVMLSEVDEWINHPGSPNLYWALSNLPRPLIDLRNGYQGERLTMDSIFPGYRDMLADPSAGPGTPLQKSFRQYAELVVDVHDGSDLPRGLLPLVTVLRTYPAAKRFLREQGRTPEQIEAMPALQAVFLYEIAQYDVAYDDLRKWTELPYHEAAPQVLRVEERLKAERVAGEPRTIAILLVSAVGKVMAAPARLERKIAALRCIEAVRLHAAAHGGKLPARLEEVTEVPIPLDPWTGKPFSYTLADGKATLSGSGQPGEMPSRTNTLRYELTIRNEKEEK
jgi:hypothetical protein